MTDPTPAQGPRACDTSRGTCPKEIRRGSWGYRHTKPCGKKLKPGAEFCGTHAPPADTGIRVYCAWFNYDKGVVIESGDVVKKTKETYLLAKGLMALGCRRRVSHTEVFTTQREALVDALRVLDCRRRDELHALNKTGQHGEQARGLLAVLDE